MLKKLLRKIKQYIDDGHCCLLLAGGGTLLAAVLFYFALHRPLAAAADECIHQAAADREAYTQVVNFQNAHLDMKEYQRDLGQRQKCVHQYLPDDMEQGSFILSLERLAVRSHLQLENVSPQKCVQTEDNCCLPVKLKVTGDYFALLKFLQGLENGERMVLVKNMSIAVKERTLEADMLLNIFAVSVK